MRAESSHAGSPPPHRRPLRTRDAGLLSRVAGRIRGSTVSPKLPIEALMRGIIDDRLLERWTTSRRHQDEARRFLARQRFSDPRGEGGALDEIAGTIADLESTLRERAARRRRPPPPPPGGPLSA